MPFGITTAPSIFQQYLEKLLEGISNLAIYFDDIAITGKNDTEHLKTLYTVFQKLKAAGLKVNLKKCSFLKPEIEYLGHIIDKNGIQPTKTKIEAILKAPPPTNIKELRSFLGLVNFYERFIPHLHSVCADLHGLTGQKHKWKWTEHENTIFEKTKMMIVKSKPLIAYNENLQIFLACDASEKGVGAVLYHKVNNDEKPIAFASRKLKPAESKYSVIDREALAIFFGIKKFDQFLRGTKFTLVTDHKPLIHILGINRNLPKLVNNRLIRWALLIGSYDYEILYKKGENNWLADYLSRMPNPNEQPSQSELRVHRITENLKADKFKDICLNEENIREHTVRDPVLIKVMKNIKINWSSHEYNDNELKSYYRKRNELSIENKILMWQGRIIIPSSLRKTTLKYLHRGHPGISAMRALIRFYVWWPSIEEDVDKYVKLCARCQENRPNNPELPIYSWSIPDKVWERLHIDFAGPFQGRYWLVLCDALSKWIEIRPMNKTTTEKLCEELNDIFTTFGLPEIIVSDNGPQFTSHNFKTYCKNRNIVHITSSPYHPRTNGLAERLVRTFKNRMSSHENDQSRSKERLQEFLFTYRNTPHNTTLKSPAQMMFGRQLTCVLDNARPNTKRMLQHKQLKANIQANDHNKIPTHATGDAVYIRTKEDKYWKPAVVTQRTHKYSYLVRTPEGVLKRRHADHMRRRVVESLPEEVIGVPTSPVIGVPTSPQFLTPAGSSPDESPVTDKPSSPVVESTSRERSTNDRNMEIIADATPTPIPPRRSTRTIRPPRRLIDELG